MDTSAKPLVGIVGPCGSGKSTLAYLLLKRGVNCRHIAQEHSYVPSMWKVITNPDVLVYLQVSYLNTITRRNLIWTEAEYNEQLFRLRNAEEHADLLINTNQLSPAQVLNNVLSHLVYAAYKSENKMLE